MSRPTFLNLPTHLTPKPHLDRFSRFCRADERDNRQTDRQTTLLFLQQQAASAYCCDAALKKLKTTPEQHFTDLRGCSYWGDRFVFWHHRRRSHIPRKTTCPSTFKITGTTHKDMTVDVRQYRVAGRPRFNGTVLKVVYSAPDRVQILSRNFYYYPASSILDRSVLGDNNSARLLYCTVVDCSAREFISANEKRSQFFGNF